MMTPQRALAGFSDLGLNEEVTELFLRGNARRVFRLGGQPFQT